MVHKCHRNVYIAGILHSHTTLKEHASTLELTLASRESSVVQLSSQVQDEVERKDREIADLVDQIKLLDEALLKERQSIKDVRKQARDLYTVYY